MAERPKGDDMNGLKFRAWDCFNADIFYSGDTAEDLSKFFAEVAKREVGGNLIKVNLFTGLTHENGTDVYGGDILHVTEFVNRGRELDYPSTEELESFSIEDLKGKKEEDYVTEVRFDLGSFEMTVTETCDCGLAVLFGNMKQSYPIFEFEVIGNIHQNPELLEK